MEGEHLQQLIDWLDKNGDGVVDIDEFLDWWITSQEAGHPETNRTFRGITREEIAEKFTKYDEDENGQMDTQELGGLVGELGYPLQGDALHALMEWLDRSGDGKISLEEFTRWFTGELDGQSFRSLGHPAGDEVMGIPPQQGVR
jgi:Ca2+-binding EF-hand superfamily protein